MENTESQEMYLTTIYKLRMKLGTVREVDVANERGFSKPSAHNALKNLANMGLINFIPGNISLTNEGFQIASNLYSKHVLLKRAFVMLGASEQSAEENACRIEHVITDDIYQLLSDHVKRGEQFLMKRMSTIEENEQGTKKK